MSRSTRALKIFLSADTSAKQVRHLSQYLSTVDFFIIT